MNALPCTCHPDDNPPRPCPQQFALTDCRIAAAFRAGAEAMRERAAQVAVDAGVPAFSVALRDDIVRKIACDDVDAAIRAADLPEPPR
jgi:hypothetical protein